MRKTIVLLALAALAILPSLAAVAAPGSCGKGKVWDADTQKCVPKPRGSGSHAL